VGAAVDLGITATAFADSLRALRSSGDGAGMVAADDRIFFR
jgi:hypothetical protein